MCLHKFFSCFKHDYLQDFPCKLLTSTYPNPDNVTEVLGRSELERRQEYIQSLESKTLLSKHPDLVQLIKECLHNAPRERPTSRDVLARLRRLKPDVEGEYGGFALDMAKVRLAKAVKSKGRRIDELTQQKVINQGVLTTPYVEMVGS